MFKHNIIPVTPKGGSSAEPPFYSILKIAAVCFYDLENAATTSRFTFDLSGWFLS